MHKPPNSVNAFIIYIKTYVFSYRIIVQQKQWLTLTPKIVTSAHSDA